MSIRIPLSRHGYVHRTDLLDRRWSPDAIRRSVRAEGLLVLRRQWIVHPEASAAFQQAASTGGRVTCVSAAAIHGLWVPTAPSSTHLALAPHSGATCEGAIIHRAIGVTASVARELLDPIENVLCLATRCLDEADALALWESAIRKGVVTMEHLRSVEWRGRSAQRIARQAGALSDSGLETLFVHRLRRFGIGVLQQVKIHGHHVDALVGSRLVMQTDGFEFHSDRATRRADLAHDRALRLLGYTVFRYSYEDVMFDWPRVEAEVRAAITAGLHRAR